MYSYTIDTTITTQVEIEAESYSKAKKRIEACLTTVLLVQDGTGIEEYLDDGDGPEIDYIESYDDPLCDGCLGADDHDKCCEKKDCCEEEGE